MINQEAMVIKGSLHSLQKFDTPEPAIYHWLHFDVLPRNQQN